LGLSRDRTHSRLSSESNHKGYPLTPCRDIGYFDALCPGQLGPSTSSPSLRPTSTPSSPGQVHLTPSPNALPNGSSSNIVSRPPSSFPMPQPQIRGFVAREDLRRQSSGTSATTATTVNEFNPQPNGRPYSTFPASRQNLSFPNPNPAPRLSRTGTARSIGTSTYSGVQSSPSHSAQGHERVTQSDIGHDDRSNRYSTGTSATFGKWDNGLKIAMGQEDQLDAVSERSPVSKVSSLFSLLISFRYHLTMQSPSVLR